MNINQKPDSRAILEACLADLESRISPDAELELHNAWEQFASGKHRGGIFSPRRSRTSQPGIEWPRVLVNETLDDYNLMAVQQYANCSNMLAEGTGKLMCVRANYGTGTMSSLFGAIPFKMDDASDTLPTNSPLEGGSAAIEELIRRGVPPIRGSLVEKDLEMGRRFADIAKRYPRISRWVHIYHPDLQSPLDVCELLWGGDMFTEFVERPELAKSFLEILTETYTVCMREWNKVSPPAPRYSVHWSMMHLGTILLREDSAMNLSPAMFEEFVAPYDQRLLEEFGGGGVHFCGRGDHFIKLLSELRGLYTVNVEQPHLNDMEIVFRCTIDRGIPLIGLEASSAEAALARGRDLKGLVHCWRDRETIEDGEGLRKAPA